ncbi:MAG: hypothetical protein NT004_11100 [Bacteroidetes bacterium]|nr:hypothetical protein [Bacteroidota bacterium]
MNKVNTAALTKPTNGGANAEPLTGAAMVPIQILQEEKEPVADVKPEPIAEVKPEPVKIVKPEMTLLERILKVEHLVLIVDKRTKLVQTRSELERFQISSNDFNCSMRLNDSDGNVFTTSFTPGVKKVIDFLKSSFDASIQEAEEKINF